jgi:hypothetical protein
VVGIPLLAVSRIVEGKLRQLAALDSVPLAPQQWVIAYKNARPRSMPRGRAVCVMMAIFLYLPV